MTLSVATLTKRTTNRKLTTDPTGRPVSVTRAALQSCPPTCPFMNNGCYGQRGHAGIHFARLTTAAERLQLTAPLKIAQAEAVQIYDNWPRDGRPLRIHEEGDCRTDKAAWKVSMAVERAQHEGGGAAWGYTHAWEKVDRRSWGRVSMLASCESHEHVREATSRGYATALVVPDFGSLPQWGVACPQQTGKAPDCASCKLCFRDDLLKKAGRTIVFKAHGDVKRVKSALERVNGSNLR